MNRGRPSPFLLFLILCVFPLAPHARAQEEVPPEKKAPAQEPPEQEPPAKPPEPPPAEQPAPKKQEETKVWKALDCYEKGRVEHDGNVTVVYHWGKPNIKEYAEILKQYFDNKVKVNSSDSAKLLIVTLEKDKVPLLEKIIPLIHGGNVPILIEARVVELRWDKDLQIGLEGDLSAGSAIFTKETPKTDTGSFLREMSAKLNVTDALGVAPFQGTTFRFYSSDRRRGDIGGIIQAFVEHGKADILSQPRLIVQSGTKATVHAGEEIPSPSDFSISGGGTSIRVKYKKVGISLDVTAEVASPGYVLLDLHPSVSTTLPQLVPVSATFQAPQFATREVTTKVLVRDGEEVMIGGLKRKQVQEIRRGLPFLSDIPFIGYLFGKTERETIQQEIIFFVKPHILSEESLPRDIFDPTKGPKQ
ncbi:MAG: type II secretion system protein GspD [Planctomycetota bacterium]|jgi:type II secretory pathway component GspD/PulD (secretin)